MSIFKKKSKAKKEETKPADDVPKPAPYRHVPQHAASDAINNGNSNRNGDREQIARASQFRMANTKNEYALGNASYAQSIAHSAMHSTPSPSSLAGQQMQWNRFQGMQRNNSTEVFTTDPSAPPMPPTPSSIVTPGSKSQRNGMPRNSTGYFPATNPAPGYDNPSMLGNHKMAVAARDRGNIPNPHYSADSGYSSADPSSTVHSRAPSEQNYIPDTLGPQPHLPRNNSSFLPELSLSEELAREPAFSEHSFNDETADVLPPKKVPESALKSSKSYASQHDQDARSVKSSKSGSKPKQTRFEGVTDSADSEAQARMQTISNTRQNANLESSVAPQPQFDFNLPNSTPSVKQASAYDASGPSQAPARKSTSTPPARERDIDSQMTSPVRYSSPPLSTSQFAPLEQVVSANSHRSIIPTSNILEGHKVNKKGKVLDEEGEVIGELYEGDLIDCVRQRVGTYGEVLDDYGSVVGRVRVTQRPVESPVLRSNTPVPSIQQRQGYDAQQYQHPIPQRPQSPAITSTRRVSAVSQPEIFTPAWQQTRISQQPPVLAQELRNHLATEPQETQAAVPPLDQSDNVYAIELDASEPMEEALPLFDHSDVFMPPPFVPARSPLRTPSPSPFVEHRQRRESAGEYMTPMSEETAARAAKYFSAPPGQRQWAAAELIQGDDSEQGSLDPSTQTARNTPSQPLGRSNGENGTSESTRTYARPAMTSVPENNVIAEKEQTPAMYSYKGEIPAEDGPISNTRVAPSRALGAKSPPPQSLPQQARNGIMAAPTPFPPINSAQFSSAGGLGPRRTQYAAGIPSLKPQLNARNSFNAPLRRSPLSSHETSPPESEEGSEDDKQTSRMQTRQPSARTMMSGTRNSQPPPSNGKPRTYFTHNGQVKALPDQAAPSQYVPPRGEKQSDAVSVSGQSSASKKRSRFSFSFGKKNQVVAAH